MKLTCNNCKALCSYGCDLGFKTEITETGFNGYASKRKPLEDCPKPVKTSDYVNLRMNKH